MTEPSLSAEGLLATLEHLRDVVPGTDPIFSGFSKALEASIASMEIPWADQQLIQWASWRGRSAWLLAELEPVLAGCSGSQKAPGPELVAMRQRYQASADGWPLDNRLNTYSAHAQFIHQRAAQRLAIHRISDWADQGTSGMPLMDQVTLDLLIADTTPDKDLQRELLGISQQMVDQPRANIVQAVKLALITKDPSLQYQAVCNLERFAAASVFADTSVRIMTTRSGIPMEIEEKIDSFVTTWSSRSPHFCILPATDIKATLNRQGTVLATVSFKDELRVVAQLIPESSFYPETQERLSRTGSAHINFAHGTLAWKYYVVTNPTKSSDPLASGVDWLKFSDEVLKDCAIVLYGAEVILGIFDTQNPSCQRHQDLGWQQTVPGTSCTSITQEPRVIMGTSVIG